jgi:hypothetical protein
MILALNTTMRACEIKGLLWQDVDLMDRTLTIRRSKTLAGQRVIPLNADAWTCILGLWERAKGFNGTSLDNFVFPACENGRIDPVNPQKSWRSAWRSLRKDAGLTNLRFHDLRHHAITELAESEASEQTIMAIAGHVSPQMLQHYSHIRLEAKRRALDALTATLNQQPRHADASHDTKYDTIPTQAGQSTRANSKKRMVGANGFEPSTSWSRTRRASFQKKFGFNTLHENTPLSPVIWLFGAVSGCAQMCVGSLQNPLHRFLRGGRAYSRNAEPRYIAGTRRAPSPWLEVRRRQDWCSVRGLFWLDNDICPASIKRGL